MRNSDVVLSNLAIQAEDESYRFDRLIRNLYNPDFYLKTIGKVYANKGAGTIGSNGTSVNGFSNKDIDKMIENIRNETYEPTHLRRVCIPKKNGRKRPIGMPNFKDKLIQEVIRLILEAIYEPIFRDVSHGFRPNRSCHTAMRMISIHNTGTKWFVEGDIRGCFDNINHNILLKLLQKKIKDEKFLRLIAKFLKCGYIEDWIYHNTYSGTPQGGIVSPILANIYLHELDKFMELLKVDFDRGNPDQQINPEYGRFYSLLHRRREKYKTNPNDELLREIKSLEQEIRQLPYYEPMDKSYKRLNYVRYADDFLVGLIGSYEDAERIKRRIRKFLKDELNLDMSEEKTLVTHVTDKAKFLGFEITARTPKIGKTAYSQAMRKANGNLEFYMPHRYAIEWLKNARAITFKKNGEWKPVARYSLTNLSDLELILIHNNELRGIYNYFKIAKNIHKQMSTLIYGLEYSCLSTMARKHKSSVGKIKEELRRDKSWGVYYETNKGRKFMAFFKESIKRIGLPEAKDPMIDLKSDLMKYRGRTEL